MNYVKFGEIDIPENAINKLYILRNHYDIEMCILQDLLGHEYTLASGEYCDVHEYKTALLKTLGWVDKSVPAVPILIKEYKTVKSGEDFSIATSPALGFSIPEYISSSDSVAMVDISGQVTISGTGYTELSIYFKEPYRVLYKRIYLTVHPAVPPINRTSKTLTVHSSGKVNITEMRDFYSPEWTSLNPDVATIDNNGNISAIKVGTAKLNGYYKFPYKAQVEEVTLNVNPSLIKTKETIKVGDAKTVVMPTIDGYSNVQWTSDRNDVVEVNTTTGVLNVKTTGTAVITGAYLSPNKIIVKQITFTVYPAVPDVWHNSRTAKVGEQFQANMLPVQGFAGPTWESDRPTVCDITPEGMATAKELGSCTLLGYYTVPYRALVQEIDVNVQV